MPLGRKTIFIIYRKKERGFLTCESCFVNIKFYPRFLKLRNSGSCILELYPVLSWHRSHSPAWWSDISTDRSQSRSPGSPYHGPSCRPERGSLATLTKQTDPSQCAVCDLFISSHVPYSARVSFLSIAFSYLWSGAVELRISSRMRCDLQL